MWGWVSKVRVTVATSLLMLSLPVVGSSCQSSDWPWGGGPLCAGALSLVAKGGVGPAQLTRRGDLLFVLGNGNVLSNGQLPLFSTQFGAPWTVGVELGWNVSRRMQFFLEYVYTQAAGIGCSPPSTGVFGSLSPYYRMSDYKANAGYVGSRFYFDRLCCCSCSTPIAPYIGIKFGFARQNNIPVDLRQATNSFNNGALFYLKQTAVSGGVQLGVEWWFCPCWNLLLQGEIVATQGLRGNSQPIRNPPSGFPSVIVGPTGLLIHYPISLGLRRTF